jgi:hypothetical protein
VSRSPAIALREWVSGGTAVGHDQCRDNGLSAHFLTFLKRFQNLG